MKIRKAEKGMDMKLNDEIKYYRMKIKMSQNTLAKKVFTTKSTVSKWESGVIVPNIDSIKSIAKALGIDFYKLVGEKEPVSKKIMNIIGKVFIWLFVWVHIDITAGVTLALTGLTFGLAAVAGSLGGGIALTVLYSINDVWTSLKVFYVIVIFISFPVIFMLFGTISFGLLKLTQYLYKFSLNVFWRINIEKHISFNIDYKKISKKWWIIIGIVTFISAVIISIFLIYLVSTDNLSNIDSSTK